MTDFGRYRLSYEPGPNDPYSGVLGVDIEMSISGEANLTQLVSFFDAFLKASGFVYDGQLEMVQ